MQPERWTVFLGALVVSLAPATQADEVVYDEALASGWADWSWATHDLASTEHAHGGTVSIRFEPDAWEGLFFHADGLRSVTDFDRVRFWVHGGAAGGQLLDLSIMLDDQVVGQSALAPHLVGGVVPAGGWAEAVIPLADIGLGPSGLWDGWVLQAGTAGDQPAVWIDDLELLTNPDPPTADPVPVAIDPTLDRRAIDPRIYGVNFGDEALHADLRFPVRRWGGNSTTRYNWQNDVHNTASDYFFQNIPADDPGTLPDGSEADLFVDGTLAHGGEPILTVPLIGWTPLSVDRQKRWSFSVAAYGPQDQVECDLYDPPPAWCSDDSGNGRCETVGNPDPTWCVDGLIVENVPADTSEPIDATFVTDWMAHVASRVGTAAEGGQRLWALDNEPMLWWDTHRDVAPAALDYDGLWDRTVAIGSAVKAEDPAAETLGPVVWGWCAYFTSAADATTQVSCVDGPDRQAHGGLPLLAWYLDQVCAYEATHGVRLVDSLDVHFYPQGGVSGLSSPGEDPPTAAKRLRSLKELWDPTWVSESWIGEPVELVPRLRGWIDDHCPAVGLAITEYRWGTDDGPSSALAHAEVLAIFGREGVDLATRWVAPEPGTRTVNAFRLFLDYDGAGSRVVGEHVRAASDDVDAVASFAVVRGGDLLVLLLNHDVAERTVPVTVAGGVTGPATLYRFDPQNDLAEIGPVPLGATGFELALPPWSANLVVLRLGGLVFADGFESGDRSAWDGTP